MATAIALISSRVCACGCGQSFKPTFAGSRYIRGHKPTVPGKAPAVPRVAESERRTLDYKLAVATLTRERDELEFQIEQADEELEINRKVRDSLQAKKDAAVDRHALVNASIQALYGILNKTPFAAVIGEA